MNKTQEALKMAILQMKAYAFKHLCDYQCDDKELLEVINTCEEALEEAEKQEPVAYKVMAIDFDIEDGYTAFISLSNPIEIGTKLYTHPATWQSLSDDEVQTVFELGHKTYREFAKAIQAKLKEVNEYD